MKKVLITYVTVSGSTAEIAEAIKKELALNPDLETNLSSVDDVKDISSFDAVVLGAPMIMGWHADAVKFLKKNTDALSKIPIAYFITSLEFTQTGENSVGETGIYLDPKHGTQPKNPDKLNFKEKHNTPSGFLEPVLKNVPQIKPVSVGFFGGKLDYSKLKLFPRLFVKIIIRGKEGDYRNWDAVKTWASGLLNLL